MILKKFVAVFLLSFLCLLSVEVWAVEVEKKLSDRKLVLSLEGGLTVVNGNSKSESYYSDLKNEYKFNQYWKNILRGRGENKVENNVRSKEYYRVNNQTRYSLSDKDFINFENEYVDDRFGGYDYRLSESVGLGRSFIDQEKIHLSGQFGVGLRQVKLSNGDKENLALGRFAMHFDWNISKNIYLDEELDISVDHEATITRSETNLKAFVNEKLYVKFSYLIENRSSVPRGIKNTDNRFMVIVGYDF